MAYTREEALLNAISSGQQSGVKPITREEQYLAYIAGESNSRPTEPITRKEHFLERIATSGVSGGSSVNVQPLSVTENGTYTAPSGVAYSPIDVNVVSSGGGGDSEADIVDGLISGELGTDFYNDRVTTIRARAFYYVNVNRIVMPSIKKLSDYAMQSSGVKEIELNACEKVGIYVANGCSNLEKVVLPNVNSIDMNAFSNCPNLKTLIVGTSKSGVCTLTNTNALNGTPIANGTGFIFVTDDLVDSYRTATNWATYASQIKGISELEG